MPCPKCGRESEVGLFCKDCFIEKNLKFDLPRVLTIEKCARCDKLFWKGKWQQVPLEKIVEGSVKYKIPELETKLDVKATIPDTGEGKAVISLNISGKNTQKEFPIRIKKTTCKSCSRKAGSYYQAVLQIRGEVNKELLEEVVDFVESLKEDAFVTNIKKIDNGFDIRLSSKKAAEKVVKRFKQKTSEIKRSKQQVSLDRQTSKQTFRFYYLLRF